MSDFLQVSSELPVGSSAASTSAIKKKIQAKMASASASSPSLAAVISPEQMAANKAAFLDKVRQSNAACQAGDFQLAIQLYTEAIQLDPANHILYSNRSAAHIKLGQFSKALQDSVKAKQLNPEWPKVKSNVCPFCKVVVGFSIRRLCL